MSFAAGALALGTASAQGQAPAPSPEAIKAAVQEVLARGPYRLSPEDYYGLDLSWLGDLIARLWHFLFAPLGGLSYPVGLVITTALVVALLALLSHIVYSFYAAMRVGRETRHPTEKIPLANPDTLEEQAAGLAGQENYVDASRMLFRAALARLEVKRGGRVMVALTNREYLRTFRTPWVLGNLRVFVELINWKWYRDRRFDQDDYLQCQGAYEALRARLSEEG